MTTTHRRALALALLPLIISCSKKEEEATPPGKAAASAEGKDMPGMDMKGATATPEAGDEKSLLDTISFTAAQIAHANVKWAPASMSSAAGTATVPGELTVNEDRTARLGASGRGRILSVRVQPGDRVSQGQALLVMQSSEAGLAQSDVAKAAAEVSSRRSQAQYAASARARAERLLAIKAIPRQDYERAIADDEQAAAALAQANAELTRARSAAEQLGAGGASASGEIVLRSPLGGVVLERPAQAGAVIEAGALLVVVTDPSTLWLQVKAPETLTGVFRRGGQLTFTVPAFPSETFRARLDAVAPGLDAMTRTLAVRGVVANTNARLKSSMLASVHVEGGNRVQAILLPEDAVQLINGQPTVFVARPVGNGARFERRTVEVGGRSGGSIAVTRGLRAGEIVVIAGAFHVKAEFQKATMSEMEM